MRDKVRISRSPWVFRVNDGPERAYIRLWISGNSLTVGLPDGQEECYEGADIGRLDEPERCPTCQRSL